MTTPTTAIARATPAAIAAVCLLIASALASCGDNDTDDTAVATTATESSPPASTDEPDPGTGSTSTEPRATTSTTAPPSTKGQGLVAADDGLTLVSFGDEAEGAIEALVTMLGSPDVDTGWQDPTDPANEPLWPGCPGATARLLQWTGDLGAVFTDWDGDPSIPGGAVPEPYFAGYGLWDTTPVRTVDGASPGMTLAVVRDIYGDRLWVSDRPDEAVELYSFAIDGTGSPLTKTGPLRGWLFPPEGTDPTPADGPWDDWIVRAFTAGVSCDTP